MRARSMLVLTALLGIGGFMVGCGSKFELPTERKAGRVVPQDGSYQAKATWAGMDGIQDVLLTQGTGTQLFLLFNHGGSGTAPRGGVLDYFQSRKQPVGHSMLGGLFNPAALCAGGDGFGGTANRVFVLDQGDTCLARIYARTGVCDSSRYWTNLNYIWRVREYGLLGGDTISTFTDTTMAFVDGVASDTEGSVYVSGKAIVFTMSNTSQFLFVRSLVSRVYKYRRGPRYPGVVPADRNLPGAHWHRDTTYFHTQGSGVGYVNDVRGMAWSNVFPAGLYVADFGNNSGQKLSDSDTTGFFRYEQDGDGQSLTAPQDIAVDASGYVYVCDTGNSRALRFDPSGGYVQRIDVTLNENSLPLLSPVALAANDSIVFIADRGRGEVIRYERLK